MKAERYTPEGAILITGGAGFIASHVAIHLVTTYPQYAVVVLDKLDYCAHLGNLAPVRHCPNFCFVQGDVCLFDFVRFLMAEKRIDTVLHFAAQSHVDNSFECSFEFTHDNILGTHVLLEAAKTAGVRRFIHVSTDEVYGEVSMTKEPCTEDTRLAPSNPYAASKAAAEMTALAYWKSFQLPVIITRSNNVYGPNQYPEKVIPKFICLLEQNKPCWIHGDGSNIRRYLYISDVVSAYDILLHSGTAGEVYNIGSDFEISNLELARTLVRMKYGKDNLPEEDSVIQFVKDRNFNDFRYAIDSRKMVALGWRPRVSFEEGLGKTMAWYLNHLLYWGPCTACLEPHPRKVFLGPDNRSAAAASLLRVTLLHSDDSNDPADLFPESSKDRTPSQARMLDNNNLNLKEIR